MKDKRLIIIFVTVFIDLVGFGIIIPLNPYLAKAFGASPFQVGLLMSVYSLMQFIFSPIWGQISDRIGRRADLRNVRPGERALRAAAQSRFPASSRRIAGSRA